MVIGDHAVCVYCKRKAAVRLGSFQATRDLWLQLNALQLLRAEIHQGVCVG